MGRSWFRSSADTITGSAAGALLCAVLTQHLHTRQAELSSEIVCWALLPLIFSYAKRADAGLTSKATLSGSYRSHSTSLGPIWLVTLCVVAVSVYRQEVGMIYSLPALTPLLLMLEKRSRSALQVARMFDSWSPSPLVQTLFGASTAATFASLTLANGSVRQVLFSVPPLAALFLIYAVLVPSEGPSGSLLPHLDLEDAIVPLSGHIVVISAVAMVLRTILVGFPTSGIATTYLLGCTKALTWYFASQTTPFTSWAVATCTATFSIFAATDFSIQSTGAQALSHVVAAILALSQTVHMLPSQAKAKSYIWGFCLFPLVPYLMNISAMHSAKSSVPASFGHTLPHPVDALMEAAKVDFVERLHGQSRSLAAARAEYKRRYSLDPPPGFDAWYDYAVAHHSPIIDEFDTIFESISPFLRLSGSEFSATASDAFNFAGSDVWECSFEGKTAKTECRHPWRSFDRHISFSVNKLLERLPGAIPDVKFLVNHLDEPRVILPPKPPRGGYSYGKRQFRVTDMKREPSFDTLTRYCKVQSKDGNYTTHRAFDVETFGLPFVTDVTANMDLCKHPEYGMMHGMFVSPSNLLLIEGLVPVLSTGAPSTMGDILFPTPAYMESEFMFDEINDVEWDSKRNNLYWAGSTTGGYAEDDRWPSFQRQRFVAFVQNLHRQAYYYLRETASSAGHAVHKAASAFLDGRLYDVAFTRFLHCDRRPCRDQALHFRPAPWADRDAALRSRLVFDLDGNGVSGRYHKLLASRSAVLKQTLLREWHDDRLRPWVHYVPVSLGMEELPELVLYLTSTAAGQERAREVAEQGREWYRKALREADMSVYVYRLMLELARLQDPEREAT